MMGNNAKESMFSKIKLEKNYAFEICCDLFPYLKRRRKMTWSSRERKKR